MLLMAARPFFIKYLIDDIITKNNFPLLVPFLILFVGVVVLERISSYLTNRYHVKVSNLVTKNEQISLYKRIQQLKISTLLERTTGDVLARILSDTEELSGVVTIVPTIIANVINLVLIASVLTYLSWQLAMVTFITLPLYYFSLRFLSTKLQTTARLEREAYSKLNESLREKIEGLWIIKGLTKQTLFLKLFSKDAEQWTEKRNRYRFSYITAQNITYFITIITPAVILGYGGMSVMRGTLTLGDLIAFFSYVQWIYEPVQLINSSVISLQRLEPLSKRFFEILGSPEEANGGNIQFPRNYSIKYEGVSFSFNGNSVLNNVNFSINENEKVAIVGLSGSGKSTLINLLCRFYEPLSGRITLGGRNLKEYKLKDLRKHIQIVRQRDYLFNMSVKENIVLDDDFKEGEIMNASKLSQIDKFVERLPEKYETLVGERGNNLSDGQKQRICIARAVIRNPRILVLDEATSAVDAETEKTIFEKLKRMNCTLIIISHRTSTIKMADKVFFLHDGSVLDHGKHEELVKRCHEYANVISNQSSE